ncbi:Uncharacterised protein [Slackia heliotrinireducens]|uniref:AAA family ATPase n=1 Tax=Slackia heliotrinireducens TaxID=84110 RepID=UPI0002FBB733|nr:AAA family ATPase [Slackia heliotrinireducens]VEG99663.1 Uncharacterised protein [Slackia heliotrinireducens]
MGVWEDLNESMSEAEAEAGETLLLPPWDAVRASDPPPLNPPLIPGIVRRGYTIEVGGKAKVGKSMFAIGLAVRVVCGGDFCGREIQGGGRCLYVDPEIHPAELHKRFSVVCDAMGADKAKVDAGVVKWTLRGATTPEGKPATISDVAHDIETRCKPGDFDLVVLDSCAALLEGDENASITIRSFYNVVLRIVEATGATVLFVVHFGKAKDGDRDPADRARGSSAWTDCPDAILTLVETFPKDGDPSDYLEDGETACLLESGGLRSFGRMEPVPLIFKYPCHRVDTEGITDGWRPRSSSDEARRNGGKATGEIKTAQKAAKNARIVAALLAHFYAEQVGEEGLIMKEAAEVAGEDPRAVADALEDCEYMELVQVTQRKRYVRPKNPPRASPEQEQMPLDGE